ncbi:MAG: DUF5011 domain-containing protein [Oscillospiraceae bacterium]|nr:DUF5011 domain-containing protein [Oscillospiraceae bacterium]
MSNMSKSRKKISLTVTLAMILPLILPLFFATPVGAADITLYSPATLALPVLNKKMLESGGVYNKYVKCDGKYNLIGTFGYGVDPLNLSYTMKADVRSQRMQYSTVIVTDPTLEQLRLDGQLSANLRASLTNDYHTNAINHFGNHVTSTQQAAVYQDLNYRDGLFIVLRELKNGDATYSLGDYDPIEKTGFYKLGSADHPQKQYSYLYFKSQIATGCGHSCGTTKLERPAFALADTVEPKIKNIYTSASADCAAPGKTDFNFADIGSKIYFHVQFSEYIRFSDNSANHSDLKLRINIASVESNQSDGTIEANLISLQDKYMTFEYAIPADFGGRAVNHFISGYAGIFDGSGKNCLNGGENAFELVLINSPIEAGELGGYGLTRSPSLITDLVGNPIAERASDSQSVSAVFTPAVRTYLDTVIPVVESVDMDVISKGAVISAPAENGRTVRSHIAPGDSFRFTVTFSEELKNVAAAGFTAGLNITDGGSPVEAKGARINELVTPNKSDKTQVIFELSVVGDTWVPASGYIKMMSLTYNGTLTDLRGNLYNQAAEISDDKIVKKFYVDVGKPNVTTSLTPSGGVYAPEKNIGETGFIFPFQMSDDALNAGGIIGVGDVALTGKFYYEANGDYQWFHYYVGTDKTPPEASKLIYGKTFNQTYSEAVDYGNRFIQMSEAELYLHVIFPEGTDLDSVTQGAKLRFEVLDNAGNSGSATFPLDENVIGQVADRFGPGFALTGEDTDPSAGTMTVTVDVSDINKVNATEIYYCFSGSPISDPSSITEWIQCNAGNTDPGTDSETIRLTLTKTGQPPDGANVYLYLKAQDCAAVKNKSYSQGFYFNKDLRLPLYDRLSSTQYGSAVHEGLCEQPLVYITRLRDPVSYTSIGDRRSADALFVVSDPDDDSGCSYFALGKGNFSDVSMTASGLTWYKGILAESIQTGSAISFTDVFAAGAAGELPDLLSGNYYGHVNVKLLIGYDGTDPSSGSVSFEDDRFEEREFNFMCAGNAGRAVHGVSLAFDDPLNWQSEADWDPNIDAPQNCIDSLSGYTFTVDISNLLMPGWNIADLNLNSSYIWVGRSPGLSDIVYSSNLDGAPGSVFRFSINEPYNPYANSDYMVRVSLVSKTTGKTDVYNYVIPMKVSPNTPMAGLSRITSSSTVINPAITGQIPSGAQYRDDFIFDGRAAYYGHDTANNNTNSYTEPVSAMIGAWSDENFARTNKIAFTKVPGAEKAFVKVWNATDEMQDKSGRAAARWIALDQNSGAGEYIVFVGGSYDDNSGKCVPVNEGENIIAYEIMYENGIVKSGVISLYVDNSAPAFDLTVTEPADKTVPAGSADIAISVALRDSADSAAYYYDPVIYTGSSGYSRFGIHTELTENVYAAGKNGVHWFYVKDSAGNITLKSIEIKTEDFTIDSAAPAVSGSAAADGNMFELNYTLTDSDIFNGIELIFNYNPEYAERLGLDDGGAIFNIPAFDGDSYSWEADTPVAHGIYEIYITRFGNQYNIRLRGVYKHDETKLESAAEAVTFTLGAKDRAGNVGTLSLDMTLANTKPAIYRWPGRGGTWMAITAQFTAPVANVTPFTEPPNGKYSTDGPYFGIYRDGAYDISFTDVFGTAYIQSFDIPFNDRYFFGGGGYDYGLDISYSTDPITGKIYCTIGAVDDRVFFNVYQYAPKTPVSGLPGVIPGPFDLSEPCVKTFEVDPDKDIYVDFYDMQRRYTDNQWSRYLWGRIGSINGAKPKVEVKWYYEETASDRPPAGGETTGGVRAFLSSDRAVTGINGKNTSFTFVYGGEESYTFEYTDAAGNTGSLTVNLPLKIILPAVDLGDADAPDYIMTVFGKTAVRMTELDSYHNAADQRAPQDVFTGLPWTQGYLLNFDIIDASPARLFIRAPNSGGAFDFADSSASINGVAVRGNQITVSDPDAEFEVVLIDRQNNNVTIAFGKSLWKMDFTAPSATVEIIQTGFNEATAYVLLTDNNPPPNELKLLYPPGLAPNAQGKYVIVFDENKSINLRFADEAGNEGIYLLNVSSIDDRIPSISNEGVTWSPFFIDSAGRGDPTKPPGRAVNSDVAATVRFNMPITDAEVTSPLAPAPNVTLAPNLSSVVITFHDHAAQKITIKYTGQNGRENTAVIDIGGTEIDKTPPGAAVAVTGDHSASATATVTVTPDEDVYINTGGSTVYGPAKPFEIKISKRGAYFWQLVDMAGNISRVEAKIENIDEEPPLVLLYDLPEPGIWTKGPVIFKAVMNKAGTISFGGADYTVTAPVDANMNQRIDPDEYVPVTLTITKNGNYSVTGKDSTGKTTVVYISINCIDDTPPKLAFKSSAVSVLESAGPAEVWALLNDPAGYSASDNNPGNISVTITNYTQASLPAKPGNYTVEYMAKDGAGNEKRVNRTLKVISLDDVAVMLNGVMTYSEDIAILDSVNVKMEIASLPEGIGEPYKVYLRSGRWTAAQMKTGGDLIAGTDFTVSKNKIYTLCIITQSRGTYLTYLYVE